MSTLRIPVPVAMATSALVFFCASTSFAEESSQQEAVTPQPGHAHASPPHPSPSVTTQPQEQQSQEQQTGTTQTTAAPYVPVEGARYAERVEERRPNRALLSTGTGIFVLSYGPSVVAAAVSDRAEDKRLFIPVVGPWMDLANRDCSPANPCGANEDVARAMIITSGVVQGAGVLMALGSLVVPESTRVSERTAKAPGAKPEVKVAPMSFGAGAGLGAVGRF